MSRLGSWFSGRRRRLPPQGGPRISDARASESPIVPAPDFSIIVPAYNSAAYLGECIESILGQRGGGRFEIIVVDDGSSDQSPQIAEKYRASYPQAVKTLVQRNRGASAARNAGLALATGTCVLFLDSDDKLGPGLLRSVSRFYRRHGSAVDLVAVPMMLFGAERGRHPLNDKFGRGTRVVDLGVEPDTIQRHTTSCFIRRSVLPAQPFDETVHYGEDALLIIRLLMNRPALGLVHDAVVHKRSRADGSSLVDHLYDKPENLEELIDWHRQMIESCRDRTGSVPPFVQSSLLYDYQWQAKSQQLGFTFRDPARRAAYIERVRRNLAAIDEERIRRAQYVGGAEKVLLSELKARNPAPREASPPPEVEVLFLEVDDHILVEGRILGADIGAVHAFRDQSPVQMEENPSLDGTVRFFGEPLNRLRGFALTLERTSGSIEFRQAGRAAPLQIRYGQHCGLALQGAAVRGIVAGMALRGEPAAIHIEPVTGLGHVWREIRYLGYLASDFRIRQLALRVLAHVVRRRRGQTILFVDRLESAADNAEHLFRHVRGNRRRGHFRLFFCLARDSADYRRLAEIGPVLAYGSLRHKIETFRATVVVSSHANSNTFEPFGRDARYLRDLIRLKRAFVPHGVMNSSQSQWCGRPAANLSLFTTTAHYEYEMMLAAPIGYTTRQLRLTGMPRYDKLTGARGDTVVFMPTWRMGLLDALARLDGFSARVASFEKSDFVREWRSIAAGPELQALAHSRGLNLKLVWHPKIHESFRAWSDGDLGAVAAVLGPETTDYDHLKRTCALLVTDYSSISFDLAYLGKPVVYYQPDAERMLQDPTWHRYAPDFDFAGQGFGPVVTDRAALLEWVKARAAPGALLDEPYRSRAEAFFTFRDGNNCRRVWEEIRRLAGGARPDADDTAG